MKAFRLGIWISITLSRTILGTDLETAKLLYLQHFSSTPHAQQINDLISQSLDNRDQNNLTALTENLSSYFESFIDLTGQQAILEVESQHQQLLHELVEQLSKFAAQAKVFVSWSLWSTKAEIVKDRRMADIKTAGQMALGFWVSNLGKFYQTVSSESAFSLAGKLSSSALAAKLTLTGLGILAFTALSFKVYLNNSKARSEQKKHLHSMIFALQELSWHMSEAFSSHQKTLELLQVFLKKIKSKAEILSLWISLSANLNPKDWSIFCCQLKSLTELEKSELLKTIEQYFSQKMSIMVLSKVMRQLSKQSKKTKDVQNLKACPEIIDLIDPVSIQAINENQSFMVNSANFYMNKIIKALESSASPTIDTSWIQTSKNIIESGQLFFDLNKPEYYQTTVRQIISRAREQLAISESRSLEFEKINQDEDEIEFYEDLF